MQRIDPDILKYGQPLAFDLFDVAGELFMKRGQVVERIDLFLAKKRLAGGLFRRDAEDPQNPQTAAAAPPVKQPPEAAPAPTGGRAVRVEQLRPNRRLRENIFDHQGVLLLAAGQVIRPAFIRKILARGIRQVVLDTGNGPGEKHARELAHQAELRRQRMQDDTQRPANAIGAAARKLERWVESDGLPAVALNPHRAAVARRMPLAELRLHAGAAIEQTRLATARHAQLADDLLRGRPMHSAGSRELLDSLLQVVETDESLPMLVMNLRQADGDQYLFQHGVNAALLSMSLARSLGLHQAQVMDVGLGALLHDVGMLRVPEHVRHARRLGPDNRKLIERHPIDTVELLSPVHALGDQVQLIAYQMHERCDGSGYPRQRTLESIHPLSRIAAVADAFTAMVVARPYRKALSPYEAVTRLLFLGRDGLFDRTVLRALLNITSLFPVGSYVQLSDGSLARVLRSNGQDHTRPVVVPLQADGRESSEELDLSRTRGVRVARALADVSQATPDAPRQALQRFQVA